MLRKSHLLIFFLALTTSCAHKMNPAATNGLLVYTKANGKKAGIHHIEQWEKKRQQVLENMQQLMGALPERSAIPLQVQYTDSLKTEFYIRYTVVLTVAPHESVPAFLYRPLLLDATSKYPAMLALHETDPAGKKSPDGTGYHERLRYAKELASKGYVVISPDYPGFGDLKDYNFDADRYESGTMKGIYDHLRAVDFLTTLPYVDSSRLGVIGHSLGGHNAIFIGAFDPRLKVVASSCGWTGFDYYSIGKRDTLYGGRLGPWAQKRYMPLLREKYGLDNRKIPLDFDDMIGAIAPRVFISSSPKGDSNFSIAGVQALIARIREVYGLYRVPENLIVYYPEGGHDFPDDIRMKVYEQIDRVLR